MTPHYIPYLEIVNYLPVNKGDVIWLTGDLVQFALQARRNKETFDPDAFINSFTQKIGEQGTLLIPAFNFNLPHSSVFNIQTTKPVTGALSEVAWRKPEFKRTWHPLHSFMVWGRYEHDLINLRNPSSFGPGSPFEFLVGNQAKMIIIGTNVAQAFTFVHLIEEREKVAYRKMKQYNIRYTDISGITDDLKFYLFAKKRGWTMCLDKLEKRLEEGNALSYHTINGTSCSVIDLDRSAKIISDDIKLNKARNIARFDIIIFFKEIVKEVLTLSGFRTVSQRIRYDQHTGR